MTNDSVGLREDAVVPGVPRFTVHEYADGPVLVIERAPIRPVSPTVTIRDVCDGLIGSVVGRRQAPVSRRDTTASRIASTLRQTGKVLGSHIDSFTAETAAQRILGWARERQSRYVAICNCHVVVQATRDHEYSRIINRADMATPDGAPVAWMLRWQGYRGQPRVSGPDLMWALCEHAARDGVPIYCYGSTWATLDLLHAHLRKAFPRLKAAMESPPFRTLSDEEDAAAIERIHASGAGIVFVGLGCPKQERWMAEHRGRLNAVMIGVGAAFDFHAGTVPRAPAWMGTCGLEWLHRLASEPARLWRRYLVTNTLFVMGAARQLFLGR